MGAEKEHGDGTMMTMTKKTVGTVDGKIDQNELQRIEDLISWTKSPVGKYVEALWTGRAKHLDSDLVFFDMEFRLNYKGQLAPKVVVWYETRPPNGQRKRGIAWWYDKESIKSFKRAAYRAHRVIAYNPWELDYRALYRWNISPIPLMTKTIDLYEFVFKYLSCYNQGNLSSISVLNGGSPKVIRKNTKKLEFQRQCERDLKMLMTMFRKVLSGKFVCSLFGEVDFGSLWPLGTCHTEIPRDPWSKELDYLFGLVARADNNGRSQTIGLGPRGRQL
jgi:hypothetical protein